MQLYLISRDVTISWDLVMFSSHICVCLPYKMYPLDVLLSACQHYIVFRSVCVCVILFICLCMCVHLCLSVQKLKNC